MKYRVIIAADPIVGGSVPTCSDAHNRLAFAFSAPSSRSTFFPLPFPFVCRSSMRGRKNSSTWSEISSSLSPSNSSRGKTPRQKQTRNRGANAANHNRRGHSFRFKDKDGKRKNTKRAPRWEREGDNLYAEVSKQLDNISSKDEESEKLRFLSKKPVFTAQDVCDALKPWMNPVSSESTLHDTNEVTAASTFELSEPNKQIKSPPFMWGPLPVGPVLASRLYASKRSSPTSIQCAAFSILTAKINKGKKKGSTKRNNAVIASPTGTGKTLAYLLPLLCTSPGGQYREGTGGVLIVTPTIELSCQIQKEVNVLWPPIEKNRKHSSLFVVGVGKSSEIFNEEDLVDEYSEEAQDKSEGLSPGRAMIRLIQNSPLIAGTPKMLRMLYREAERIAQTQPSDDPTISHEERLTSLALLSNLRAIVLDEADRLLRTEAVAREFTDRKQSKIGPPSLIKKKKLNINRQTQTELLLRELPVSSLSDVQIICASATVGRTMRRQLMQILGSPSADAAAALVTGEEDARVKSKDAEKRKSVLLPKKLQHAYRVVSSTIDENLPLENESSLDAEMLELSVAQRNEEKRVDATIRALWDTMLTIKEAKPTIIFPGRVKIDRVQKELLKRGLNDVRTLRTINGVSPESNRDAHMNAVDAGVWKSIPIYVIGERFARGLDLPEIGYVIILTPPSSAAGYAHMAGRTGRNDQEGTAITFVRPKNNEVYRLAAIAESLGLSFVSSLSGIVGSSSHGDEISSGNLLQIDLNQKDHESSSSELTTYFWAHLSESAIKRKKISDMHEYLAGFGKDIDKKSTKAEMLKAIEALHNKSEV